MQLLSRTISGAYRLIHYFFQVRVRQASFVYLLVRNGRPTVLLSNLQTIRFEILSYSAVLSRYVLPDQRYSPMLFRENAVPPPLSIVFLCAGRCQVRRSSEVFCCRIINQALPVFLGVNRSGLRASDGVPAAEEREPNSAFSIGRQHQVPAGPGA